MTHKFWVLVISHIWDILFPSFLFLPSFPLSFLPLFSFVLQLLWLWLMTYLTTSLLSTMEISSFLCSRTWSRGHWPQLAVELLWKSGVVLRTEDSHAVSQSSLCPCSVCDKPDRLPRNQWVCSIHRVDLLSQHGLCSLPHAASGPEQDHFHI